MCCSKFAQENENPDFFSQLPEPVIHHIISLFSSNKDCARTYVLSKKWRNLYYSRPNIIFNEKDFIRGNSYIISPEGRSLFLHYVGQSLNRCIETKSNHLEIFQLDLSWCIHQSHDLNLILQKVFDLRVKTMSLMVDFLDNLSHLVLDCDTLVEMHLGCFSSIKECKTMNFPNLKVLSLFHIDLPDRALKTLISGCPCVEILRLSHCSTSQNLQLWGLTRLVELTMSFCRLVKTVEIGSFLFQTLSLNDQWSDNTNIKLVGCEMIRNMHLSMWLSNELFAFKWLAELRLISLVIKSRISSLSIKRLVISYCGAETNTIEIDCPNLLSLEYEDNDKPFHFVSECDVRDFRYEFSLLQNGRSEQMRALKKLFGSTFGATKNLNVVIVLGHLKYVFILDGLIKVMLSILNNIGELLEPKIFITSDSIDWNAILPNSYPIIPPQYSYPIVSMLAVNVVSLYGSTFVKDVWKKILSLKESQTGKYANISYVKKDYIKKNIPVELQPPEGSQYQMGRIILKFDW